MTGFVDTQPIHHLLYMLFQSVDEFKPAPGVVVEKESIGRGTPDMKGCYALIYRRTEPEDPHSTDALRLPPPSVVSKIEEEVVHPLSNRY